jgi:hypothetical protein
MHIEIKPYGGWERACYLSNGALELVVTLEVGPRVIHAGLLDGPNHFAQFADQMGQRGGDEWRIYGGHRLWHAPEDRQRTYSPDNDPVEMSQEGETVHFDQPTDQAGIRKRISVRLHPNQPQAHIEHRLTNENAWPISLAPWSLSVMQPGGRAILPLPPRGDHATDLLPGNRLILWKYTDMSNPRWTWGREYIFLDQDAQNGTPQKIGLGYGGRLWLAYANHGQVFVKTCLADGNLPYADMDSSLEVFTNWHMLELETLGPLQLLAPGAQAVHHEDWIIFDQQQRPQTEADVSQGLWPRIEAWFTQLT